MITFCVCNRYVHFLIIPILFNEKLGVCLHCIDSSLVLQKKYTVDFLTKKQKVNEGEVPQYYVENSHPAIIAPEEFEAVQAEFQRRKSLGRRYSGQSVLAARIVCGDCGDFYGSKVWHSNSKYRRVIWRCNSKFDDGHQCSTPTLDEADVKTRFLVAYNTLFDRRETLIEDVRLMRDALTNCDQIEAEIQTLSDELTIVVGMLRKYIEQNASTALDQAEYADRYQSLTQRYDAASTRLQELADLRDERANKAAQIGGFLAELMERDQPLEQFDDHLWLVTVEKVTAYHDGRLVFKFYNGLEVAA